MSSPLREALEEVGGPLKDLTVLAPQNDPFRLDTPARHRNGKWFAKEYKRLRRRLHRGSHYALLSRKKPDGTPYTSTDEDWEWLQKAAKAARWLGYLGFEDIKDERNDEPVIRRHARSFPTSHVGVDGVEVPDTLRPYVFADGFAAPQAYRLVFFGEKSSLEAVVDPLAEEFSADLYLCSGEISDTLAHTTATEAVGDGRPLVVFALADGDPSGWQMAISIARKLQGFELIVDGMPDWQVRRAALTPSQIRTFGLPDSPLKDEEKRANAWTEAFGVRQTEIDALATLRLDLLRDVVRQAVRPFFDETLARRAREARDAWHAEARQRIDECIDAADAADTDGRLDEIRDELEDLRNDVAEAVVDVELPPIEPVEPSVDGDADDEPLIDSRWGFEEGTYALIESKQYRNGRLDGNDLEDE
jgi:hypothetical protein